MAKPTFEKSIYITRRRKLKETITQGIGLFLGNQESPMNYPDNHYRFRQDSTFAYFFGLQEPNLAAVINFETGEEILFGNDLTIDDIIWEGGLPKMQEKAESIGCDKSLPLSQLKSYIDALKDKKIHFLPMYRAENMKRLASLNGTIFYSSDIKFRSLIRADQGCSSFTWDKGRSWNCWNRRGMCSRIRYASYSMKMAVSGVKESDIAGIIEGIAAQYGGLSFPVICSQNGQTLHNHDHSGILKKGRLLLVDSGAQVKSLYASDFTRTTPVDGKFTSKQLDVYNIVLRTNNVVTRACKPGITYASMHTLASRTTTQGLIDIGLMKGDIDEAVAAGAHTVFFPHGLGHAMGLDVHDMEDLGQVHVGFDKDTRPSKQFGTSSLRFGKEMKKGHVLTNEPGIYFIPELIQLRKSEKKFTDFINYSKVEKYLDFGGIRIEDDILITEDGCRVLGERIPVTANEIEEIVGS